MAKKRIVLANLPRMLATIVTSLIDRQPDMSVVGSVKLGDVTSVASCVRAEAVVLTPSRLDPTHATREALRRSNPGLVVLELRVRDDRAVLWSPGAEPAHVDLTAAAIVGALRDPARSATGGAG